MKRFMLLGVVLGVALLASLPALAPASEQDPGDGGGFLERCHAGGIFDCLGSASVMGSPVTFNMTGGDALARVESFSTASKSRNVAWTNFQMKGLTNEGAEITASLDRSRKSSGTLLSIGNGKFPATATMRFFLRLETAGMTLVSAEPAVFQGVVRSIPPSPGDSLALISSPVRFHEEGGDSTVTMATLDRSKVVYHKRRVTPPDAERGDRLH